MPETLATPPRRWRAWLAGAGRAALVAGLCWMGWDLAMAQQASTSTSANVDATSLFATHCASCHGAQRTGGMGPALLPESLARLPAAEELRVIAQGRTATQMPAFAGLLSPAEIQALGAFIRTPVVPAPRWTEVDIRASREFHSAPAGEPATPVWSADPMNLFVVVEGGDHHVSLLDGDRLEVITRFASRFALHGGPKFSPDGRYVYFGSRDGWITKYDLYRLRVVAEVRAGLNMRNVAVSGDGRWVIAANYLPHTLALFDSDLQLVRTYDARTLDGKAPYVMAGTLDRAVELAAADAEAGAAPSPVVLLSPACASYDQFKDFEQRGDIFRDLVAKLPRMVDA